MNILSEIIATKQKQLEQAKQSVSSEKVREAATSKRSSTRPHSFRSALLNRDRVNIIAEFKRRSPSKGYIREDADPIQIARDYAAGGAVGISVLTEENYFDGSLEDLRAIRREIELPLLRKDFIVDEYQVYEAAAAGADAVLLIVAALDDAKLESLRELIEDKMRMDALVEVHDEEEIVRADKCGATLIGVNNRNLRTFEVTIETSLKLIDKAPEYSVLVSESGLNTAADLKKLREVGYNGFLIGESLMRAESPKMALEHLLKAT